MAFPYSQDNIFKCLFQLFEFIKRISLMSYLSPTTNELFVTKSLKKCNTFCKPEIVNNNMQKNFK